MKTILSIIYLLFLFFFLQIGQELGKGVEENAWE